MKTPAKINASRDESGKMLIGLDGTGAGLLLLAGRIASGVLVTVASNEKELAELKNSILNLGAIMDHMRCWPMLRVKQVSAH